MKVRHNKIRADINEIEDQNQTKWTNHQVGWPKKKDKIHRLPKSGMKERTLTPIHRKEHFYISK